jgi:hypothetical protein
MKKWLLLSIILAILPLIAQDADAFQSNYMTTTGLVIEVESQRINFEEMWLSTARHTMKKVQPVIIVDIADEPITLSAPCLVELTYEYGANEELIPLKIKVLKQYEYENGMIKVDKME